MADLRLVLENGRTFFTDEPRGLEDRLRARTTKKESSTKEWADAYMVSFAEAAGLRFVTFDKALAGRARGSCCCNRSESGRAVRFCGLKILHPAACAWSYRQMSGCMGMGPDEFRGVVEEHQRMVFSIALRVTSDYSGAEEVAQDVFLELFRGTARLDGADHLRFWLRRVSVHRATDWLRRQKRQPETGAEAWVEEEHGAPAEARDAGSPVQARLEDLLGTLPETLRVAMVLRYQEEMLPDEIARLLGQPVATVKSNLRRGLELLRRKAEVTMKEYVR